MSFDESKINDAELVKYEKDYSKDNFINKILKYGKSIGGELLYKAAQLYIVLQKPDISAADKAIVLGALGYLISAIDFVPDITPIVGYSDDLVAIGLALLRVNTYIDDDVKVKAKYFLANILGEGFTKDL